MTTPRTIPVFIPYINRPDLLTRALSLIPDDESIQPIVINNSGRPIDILARPVIIHPSVPLTFTQSQNLMLAIAQQRDLPFYCWMHCDAEPSANAVERLVEMAWRTCSERRKWSVIFTLYDILAAYSTAAFTDVGGYDTAFFDYCSDQDVYHRLDLLGYARLESGIEVGHVGSQTINSDERKSLVVGAQVPYRSSLYLQKWGGPPGAEVYSVPWDRPDLFGDMKP